MSVVVGVNLEGIIYLGADSAVTDLDSCDQQIDPESKIFVHGEVVYALTGNPEQASLLRFFVQEHEDQIDVSTKDALHTFVASFMDYCDMVSVCTRDPNDVPNMTIAIATSNQLWTLHGHYISNIKKYTAFGCGAPYAFGALFSGADIETALKAACQYDSHCSLPLSIYEISSYGEPNLIIVE